jgi:hypothetical protein
MSSAVNRGDGVGIEVGSAIIRGVRLRHDVPGRMSTAVELPFRLADDDAALDALVVLRAELGEPHEPTRIAMFPANAMMQRIDITGRSGPEMNELRSRLDRRHGITSTVVADDGPRRWLLVIRWDANAARRLEDLAEHAGFVDVTVEPSPLALARVCGPDDTYARRLVAQSDSHHFVMSNRLPVAALAVPTTGRSHPDVDIAELDIQYGRYDDFMTDAALGEVLDRVNELAGPAASEAPIHLEIVGESYPLFPAHDSRSAQRQAVALGAAVGAAGLAGPLRPVDVIASAADSTDEQFDRPWAIEAVTKLPDLDPERTTPTLKRLGRILRPGQRR